jgi:uncharacterized membrane protein required for colicin V production
MISLNVLLFIFIILFGLIGSMRGWAKELLVTTSVILALFIITVLERFVPFIQQNLAVSEAGKVTLFWLRVTIVTVLVFFGYQSPNIPRLAATNRFARERLQDGLLGLFLGALNGYLFFGTIWFYLNNAGYPFPSVIIPPQEGTVLSENVKRILPLLPPHWLGQPAIYFAVAIAFAFILVVFI